MTKRQKHIVSCINPYYNGFATKNEVKKFKRIARGKYWYDSDNYEYVSISPGGKRNYFQWEWYGSAKPKLKKRWKSIAKQCAILWSKGKCAKAVKLTNESYNDQICN